jgi:hypothetical protein
MSQKRLRAEDESDGPDDLGDNSDAAPSAKRFKNSSSVNFDPRKFLSFINNN